jgi:UDP-N-acetylmuramoyl-L-alanyl-D-glutamate--2,6-diaminopimelate ligase
LNVINYAHTADASISFLQTVRESGARQIFHIFGFRGNQNRKKHRKMVLVSGEINDVSILLLNDLINIPFEELEKPV